MKITKIILSAFLLLVSIRSLAGLPNQSNGAQAAGFLTAALIFIFLSGLLLYSGINQKSNK